MSRILVVGGAGYIGSHMVKRLLREGREVTVFDSLETGYRDAVGAAELVVGDLADREALAELFATHEFEAVMHFASYIQVGESVREPAKYYRNNVANTQNLLDAMVAAGVGRFVFSSTAALFGEPHYSPIDEVHPIAPLNPYGRSKWMIELMLEDYEHAYGVRSICFRYFNAAGADPEGELGERHEPETHLIPLLLQAALGRRPPLTVFGSDYPTADGTCIRDYIHVEDLCEAHLLALARLADGGGSDRFNLGNGRGFSVKEVVEAAERVVGEAIPVRYGERRPGDAPVLVADAKRAREVLGWAPRYTDLDTLIAHAWAFERSRRDG